MPRTAELLVEVGEILSRIRDLLPGIQSTWAEEIERNQVEIDEAVSRTAQLVSTTAFHARKPHWDMVRWRKRFPKLDDPSILMMMDWRRANPNAQDWPQAEVEDILDHTGRPTGKLRVTAILSASTAGPEGATVEPPTATSASPSGTSSTGGPSS